MSSDLFTIILSGSISLVAAIIVASLKTRGEYKKLAKESKAAYASALFEKRIEVYLELYKVIGRCNSLIEQKQFSIENLEKHFSDLDDWLTTYGLFLTGKTSSIAWGLRNLILLKRSESEVMNLNEDFLVEIRNSQLMLGKFLRVEIGIFDTEPVGIPNMEKPHIVAQIKNLKKSSKILRERFGY